MREHTRWKDVGDLNKGTVPADHCGFTLEALEPRVLLNASFDIQPSSFEAPVQQSPVTLLESQTEQAPVSTNGIVLGSFGAVSGGSSSDLTLRDSDMTAITFALTGPGVGRVEETSEGWNVHVEGTDSSSRLTITTTGGDNRVVLNSIILEDSLGSLVGTTTRVQDLVLAKGALGSLTVGAVDGGTIIAPSIRTVGILNDLHDARILVGSSQALGDASVPAADAATEAGSLRVLYVGGSVSKSLIVAGPDASLGQSAGTAEKAGAIGMIWINGSLSTDSQIIAPKLPETAWIDAISVKTAGDPRFDTAAPATSTSTASNSVSTAGNSDAPATTSTANKSVSSISATTTSSTSATTTHWNATLGLWKTHMLEYGKRHADTMRGYNPKTESSLGSTYYDAERVYYQIARYTGDSSWLSTARLAETFYRDAYVLEEGGAVPGYWNFTRGLRLDYEQTGDAQSKQAIILLSQKADYAKDSSSLSWSTSSELSREVAYALMAHLDAEAVGATPRTRTAGLIDQALGHLDQWFVSKTAPYMRPFMVGLTMQALIQAYEAAPDARIPQAIKTALDGLWARTWVPSSQAFMYTDRVTAHGGTGPAPDLNLLIAPAYAWLYKQTGDGTYRDRGDQVFEGGVKYAYLTGVKQFNQNYMWSFDYVRWRGEAETLY